MLKPKKRSCLRQKCEKVSPSSHCARSGQYKKTRQEKEITGIRIRGGRNKSILNSR